MAIAIMFIKFREVSSLPCFDFLQMSLYSYSTILSPSSSITTVSNPSDNEVRIFSDFSFGNIGMIF
jgi:hypothetical protein